VVDNFGDIGVCWRLARQLAAEHAISVRLWVDDLRSAERLVPALDAGQASQRVDGVEIRRWEAPFLALEPGQVVVAAFACRLPEVFVEAMARRQPRPVWINLEYLSAEGWVADCHALPSPHPRLPLVEHFFFPGFDGRTGGVLREADYAVRRAAFSEEGFRASVGSRRVHRVSCAFRCFPTKTPGLPTCSTAGAVQSIPSPAWFRKAGCWPAWARLSVSGTWRWGERLRRGALSVQVLPFVEQRRYDALLWACDLNFVRGRIPSCGPSGPSGPSSGTFIPRTRMPIW
jgi:uncharacterized repeat protein (TIGR03837 family)